LWLTWRVTIARPQRALRRCRGQRVGFRAQVRRVDVVLAGDANEGEQGVAASVGQRGAHALGIGGLGDRTDRPIRGDPLAGGVGKHGGQIDHASGLIDRGRL